MSRVVFRESREVTTPPGATLGALLARRRHVAGPLPAAAAGGGPLVVFEEEARLDMLAAAHGDLRREQVGVLYGTAAIDGDQPWLHVTHAIHARGADGNAVHVELDAGAWAGVHARAAELGLGGPTAVVGWFHTHPDLGAFYSGTDRHTQARAFPRPWQVGIVLDPVRGEQALYRGGDSAAVALRPVTVSRRRAPAPYLPAEAMLLELPPDAADLGAAAWTALARARNGAAFAPLGDRDRSALGALVLDRPALKRRFPGLRDRLSSRAAAGGGGWRAALPLASADVACVFARGLRLGLSALLARSPS